MSSKEALIKKYATKSAEDMAREQDKLKEEVVTQSLILDDKIRSFSGKIDPILSDTGETLAYAKRPSAAQSDRLLPPRFLQYRDNPSEIPQEEALAYVEDTFKLMEELITTPKHSMQEWKELAGDDFIAAFQAHFLKIKEEMSKTIERFLRPTTASTK